MWTWNMLGMLQILLIKHFRWARNCWFAFAPSHFFSFLLYSFACSSMEYIDQKSDRMNRVNKQGMQDIEIEKKNLIYRKINYINYSLKWWNFFVRSVPFVHSALAHPWSECSCTHIDWISCSIIGWNEMKWSTMHCDMLFDPIQLQLVLNIFHFAFYFWSTSQTQVYVQHKRTYIWCCGSKSIHQQRILNIYRVGTIFISVYQLRHPIRVTRDDDYALDKIIDLIQFIFAYFIQCTIFRWKIRNEWKKNRLK